MSIEGETASQSNSGAFNEFLNYWSSAGDKIREAAKWSATVLGATLAALIGTSPLTVAREDTPPGWAILLGLIGLALLAICLLLVLNVLLPKLISFADLEHADRDDADSVLNDWRRRIHGEKDLYLPSGVSSLTQLREAAVVEDLTLDKLAKQIYEQGVVDSANEERSKVVVKDLKLDKLAKQIYERVVMNVAKDEPSKTVDHCKLALRARTARLNELVRTADQLVTIAGFQQLRHRGETARKWGVGLGSLATVLIVAAFAWPSSAGPYSEKQVQLSAQGAAHFADTLGQSCNEFTAVVLEDKGDRFYALVRPNESCRSAEVWIDQRDTIKRGPQ